MTRSLALASPVAVALAVSFVCGVPRVSAQSPPPEYDIVELPVLDPDPNYASASASDINASGQVVGGSSVQDPESPYEPIGHAFLYSVADGMVDINPPDGTRSFAVGLNDATDVVGTYFRFVPDLETGGTGAYKIEADHKGFLYRASTGTWATIDPFGAGRVWPWAIDDAGTVVGVWYPPGTWRPRGFLWREGVEPVDLTPDGWDSSMAVDINDAGDILLLDTELGRAFVLRGGVGGGLTEVMPAEPGQPVSAWALNDLGQVVGSTPFRNSQTQALENHAFLWDGETMDDLGSGGGLGTVALDVNDAGHVVGFQGIGDPTGTGPVTRRAFFYDGQMWTFDGLGDGLAINDTDQIVASGWDAYTGNPRAFLLTPRSPSRVISGLIGAIDGFVLPKGLETGLVSKLEAALAAIERGDSDAACGELGAFINHVEAQRGKGLTDEQADALVAGATQARTLLGCS